MKYSLHLYFSILFLMIVSVFCEGITLRMELPSHSALYSEMRVKCNFTSAAQITKMTLLHGNTEIVASYMLIDGTFKISPSNKISLEVNSGTTAKGGSLTFVISQLTCNDFTSYMCKAEGFNETVYSVQKTLQVLPTADSIMKTSISTLVVNEISIFVCKGTIDKNGLFSVQWYRKSVASSNDLTVRQAEVIGENQCSRIVSSSLVYYVREDDGPNLILWCRIVNGRTIDKMEKFPIQGVYISMPSYNAINTEMRVKCDFKVNQQVTKISLLHGDTETTAFYSIEDGSFQMTRNNKISLEVDPGTTVKGGSLTFVISQLTCSDFTWYMCKAEDFLGAVYSTNKTLQVLPVIHSIELTPISDFAVNQIATFICRATISTEGSFSVQWYRKSITPSNQLPSEQASVNGQNHCSRDVSSSVSYKVSETDSPAFILWCQLKSGRTIDHNVAFTIAGAGCALKENGILALMISFIVGTFNLF